MTWVAGSLEEWWETTQDTSRMLSAAARAALAGRGRRPSASAPTSLLEEYVAERRLAHRPRRRPRRRRDGAVGTPSRGSSGRARSRRARRRSAPSCSRGRGSGSTSTSSNEPTDPRLGDQLAGEVGLAVGEAASDGRPDARRDLGVERVEVERDVDEARARYAVERLPHRALDPDPVDVAHREDADARLVQERALGGVERADADEDDPRRVDGRQRSAPRGRTTPAPRPSGRGERHPVDVPRRARLGRVEIAVGVDPDDATRLTRGRGEAGQRPDRDRVVAAEHERQRAVAHVCLDERGEPAQAPGSRAGSAPARRRARAPPARARRRCRGRGRRARSRASRSSRPA